MDWIAITCWVVLGASGLLALWALFWDRPRGRLRCRKCAYDMSGGGLTCPECGREHKSEQSLKRTRRKWKTAVVLLAVVLFTMHYRAQRVLIAYEGAMGLVPSVLLAACIDMNGYSNFSPNESDLYHNRMNAYEAMDDRIHRVAMSRFSRRIFAHRLARYASKEAPVGYEVRVHDISSVIPIRYRVVEHSWSSVFGSSGLPEKIPTLDLRDSLTLAEGLMYIFDKDVENMNETIVGCIGDQFVFKAPPAAHELIESAIHSCENNIWNVGDDPLVVTDENPMTGFVYIMPWTDEGLDPSVISMWDYRVDDVMLGVAPERWDYGDERESFIIGGSPGRILIWAAEDHQREIQKHLNTLDYDSISD